MKSKRVKELEEQNKLLQEQIDLIKDIRSRTLNNPNPIFSVDFNGDSFITKPIFPPDRNDHSVDAFACAIKYAFKEPKRTPFEEGIDYLLKKETEPKYKKGLWYNRGEKSLVRCTKNSDKLYGYGFYFDGEWCNDNDCNWGIEKVREATKQEVEQALFKYADKMGYLKDVMNFCDHDIKNKDTFRVVKSYLVFNGEVVKVIVELYCSENNLCYTNCTIIMRNGKWVEIIKDKAPVINGYKMEVEDGVVSFGCFKFSKTQLITLYNQLIWFNGFVNDEHEPNCKITSINLDLFHLTIDELEEIANYINK